MSRLWNDLARKLWPVPARSLGISFARDAVHLVDIDRVGDAWRIQHTHTLALPFPLFLGVPPHAGAATLAAAMAAVCGKACSDKWIPIGIALPDPAVGLNVLELASIPKRPAERDALARWRLEKHLPKINEMACITESLGQENEKNLLLTLTVERTWLDMIQQALHQIGVIPWSLQPSAILQFNHHYNVCSRAPGDGALLVLASHAWALLIWDAARRPRFCRSRWRAAVPQDDAAEIALETERAIRAYVHAAPGRHLGALWLAGDPGEMDMVAERLEARMAQTVIQRLPEMHLGDMPVLPACAGTAMIAALSVVAA